MATKKSKATEDNLKSDIEIITSLEKELTNDEISSIIDGMDKNVIKNTTEEINNEQDSTENIEPTEIELLSGAVLIDEIAFSEDDTVHSTLREDVIKAAEKTKDIIVKDTGEDGFDLTCATPEQERELRWEALKEKCAKRSCCMGTVVGVEPLIPGREPKVITMCEGFQVVIPVSDFFESEEFFRDDISKCDKEEKFSRYGQMAKTMFNLVIPFVITSARTYLNENGKMQRVVVGSRKLALKKRREAFFLDKNSDRLLENNDYCYATVIRPDKHGLWIEVAGVECFIHINDISYSNWVEPFKDYAGGKNRSFRVQIRDLEVNRETGEIKFTPISKDIDADEVLTNYNKCMVGASYMGEVIYCNPKEGYLVNLFACKIRAKVNRSELLTSQGVEKGDYVCVRIRKKQPENLTAYGSALLVCKNTEILI